MPDTTWTQETVGDSGIATTTSTPETTWTTELIGAHIAGDSLTIDNIKIDGSTIGHIEDADILQFGTGGILQVNGSVAGMTSLNTNIIRNLTGTNNMFLTGSNVEIVGDLTISGGNITNAITCDSTLTVASTFTSIGRAGFDGDQVNLSDATILTVANLTDASSNEGSSGSIRTKGGMSIAKKLYVGTDLDVDGVTNLDAVDIDGNVQLDGALTIGVDDTGQSVTIHGNSSGHHLMWDTGRDALLISQDSKLYFHDFGAEYIYADTDNSLKMYSGGNIDLITGLLNFTGNAMFNDTVKIGDNEDGQSLTVCGTSAGATMTYNVTNDSMYLNKSKCVIRDNAVDNASDYLELVCEQAAGASIGPNLRLMRGDINAATPTVGSLGQLGSISFEGQADDEGLAVAPYGNIRVESYGIVKDSEYGAMFLEVALGGGLSNGMKMEATADGKVQTTIGINPESLCFIAGDVKLGGNDIKSSTGTEGTTCISLEVDETTVAKLKATQCLANFDFITNSATVKMSGDDQSFLMYGDTPIMKIGKANETNKSSGYLELGYASGTTGVSDPADVGLPGIINLCKKSGSGGGNAYLWVDSSGNLRIAGSMPHGYPSHSNYYETHGVKVADQ